MDAAGKPSGISMVNVDRADDVAVLGMIDCVTKNGTNITPTQDFLDELPETDFKILLQKVEELTKEKTPKA